MLAVIRHYEHVAPAAARSIIDARVQIEALLRGVPGTERAMLIRTRDGLALVAFGGDEWCLAECGRRFRAWADTHVAGFRGAADAGIWFGEVIGSSGASSLSPRTAEMADPSPGGESEHATPGA